MLKIVNNETKALRFAICSSCDQLHKTLKTCGICHCFMPAKTAFASASCPIKRWSKADDAVETPSNTPIDVK
jgi:hypothetical protein